MIDINGLPDAMSLINQVYGNKNNGKDGLYKIYYEISTAVFEYRTKHNFSQKSFQKS